MSTVVSEAPVESPGTRAETRLGDWAEGRGGRWAELLEYRDLLYFLVRRDIRTMYAQTVLGFAWAVLRPLLSTAIFAVVFGALARVPSDGVPYPLFAYAALVPWTYFATATGAASNSLVSNAGLLGKVYFPRLVIPLVPIIGGLVDLGMALGALAVMMGIARVAPAPTAPLLVVPLVLMVLCTTGVSLWLSALAVRYRDVKHGVGFLLQVLMYAAPVAWPVSLLEARVHAHPELTRLAFGLYPMVGVVEGFRSAIFGTVPMPWDLLGAGYIATFILIAGGARYFARTERLVVDLA